MATLTEESLGTGAADGERWEPESWGLLLIPVLLSLGMLLFALAI